MRASVYILIFLFISNFSSAQKHRAYGSCPYETSVKTIEFIVLDINYEEKLVAFKHIYELQTVFEQGPDTEIEKKPIDCQYAGMEKYPKAGVILGVYDLGNEEYLKTFTIYKSCFDQNECYDHDWSEKNLNSAKQLFNGYGLDIGKKPKPIMFTKESGNKFQISVNGINFNASYKNDYDNQLTISYLYAENNLLYQVEYDDNFVMASNGEVIYTAAYTNGDKIVFLNKFFHNNNLEGYSSYEYFHFTPIFKTQLIKQSR